MVNENDNEAFMGEPSSNEAFMEESGSNEAFMEEPSSHFLATNTPPGFCTVGQKGNPVEQIMTTCVIYGEFDTST